MPDPAVTLPKPSPLSCNWRLAPDVVQLNHGSFGAAPTARLCVPAAIETVASFVDGGWPAVRCRNHDLALAARDALCGRLGVAPPVPDDMVGSMAAVPIPEATESPGGPFNFDPLQDELFNRWRIEVPVITWLPGPGRVIRVSAQLYNSLEQVEYLADVMVESLLAPA